MRCGCCLIACRTSSHVVHIRASCALVVACCDVACRGFRASYALLAVRYRMSCVFAYRAFSQSCVVAWSVFVWHVLWLSCLVMCRALSHVVRVVMSHVVRFCVSGGLVAERFRMSCGFVCRVMCVEFWCCSAARKNKLHHCRHHRFISVRKGIPICVSSIVEFRGVDFFIF